jgi:hypothetical protein
MGTSTTPRKLGGISRPGNPGEERLPRTVTLDYLREFDLWGLEDKITCPILNIAGEGEGSLYVESHKFYERLKGPKRERLVLESKGGEAHTQVNNRNLANQIEFDFLDDVFAETA